MSARPFVIRVYGIYVHPDRGVLVSDEFIFGRSVTKFPGGGLEFGEGTVECLIRELQEEIGQDFDVLEHFYTTDFFVPSAFDPTLQVMSVYYRIAPREELAVSVSDRPFDFKEQVENAQSFRFIPLEEISGDIFTLVIDQRVGAMIRARMNPSER